MSMNSNYKRGTKRGHKQEDYLKVFTNTCKVDYLPVTENGNWNWINLLDKQSEIGEEKR